MITEFAGYTFKNPSHLENALTHTSFANERKLPFCRANERLEFLGDAALELSMSHYLYESYGAKAEGDLTRMRAGAVCEPTLAKIARRLGLGAVMLMGKGEETTGGRDRDSTLSDCFEAVVGAVFLDGGFAAARDFVVRLLKDEVESSDLAVTDYKTYLQEYLQRTSVSPINYAVVRESGPDHDKRFTVNLEYEGRELSAGTGKTKKEAEQNAARAAIEALGARKEAGSG
jgi:ribonuclease-3